MTAIDTTGWAGQALDIRARLAGRDVPTWHLPAYPRGRYAPYPLGQALLAYAAHDGFDDATTDAYVRLAVAIGRGRDVPDWAAGILGVPLLAGQLAGRWTLAALEAEGEPIAERLRPALSTLWRGVTRAKPSGDIAGWLGVQREAQRCRDLAGSVPTLAPLVKLGLAGAGTYPACLRDLLIAAAGDLGRLPDREQLRGVLLEMIATEVSTDAEADES